MNQAIEEPKETALTEGTVKSNAVTIIPEAAPLAMLNGLDLNNLNTDALEQIMDLQERYDDRNAKKAFYAALANFQAEMPHVHKTRKGPGYTYAALDDIMKVAGPILQKNGLSVSFPQTTTDHETNIICRVMHRDGHFEETPYSTEKSPPIKTRDGRNVTNLEQAGASSNSFAKRYCLCNALNIIVTDEDDNATSVTPAQETPTFTPAPKKETAPAPKASSTREDMIATIKGFIDTDNLTDGDLDDALSKLMNERITDWSTVKDAVLKRLCTPEGWEKVLKLTQGEEV